MTSQTASCEDFGDLSVLWEQVAKLERKEKKEEKEEEEEEEVEEEEEEEKCFKPRPSNRAFLCRLMLSHPCCLIASEDSPRTPNLAGQ